MVQKSQKLEKGTRKFKNQKLLVNMVVHHLKYTEEYFTSKLPGTFKASITFSFHLLIQELICLQNKQHLSTDLHLFSVRMKLGFSWIIKAKSGVSCDFCLLFIVYTCADVKLGHLSNKGGFTAVRGEISMCLFDISILNRSILSPCYLET